MAKLLNLLILPYNAVMALISHVKQPVAVNPLPKPKSFKEVNRVFIKESDVLMNRIAKQDLPSESQSNLATLVERLNLFFANYSGPIVVSSGYRDPSRNATIGGATKSHHMTCAAIDLADSSGKVWQYCLDNLSKAKSIGLWFEDRRWTPSWTHCQIVAPKSGKRIFVPNAKPPIAPRAFSGKYDSKYD